MPTSNLADVTVPNTELYGLTTTNNGRIVVFGGGIPLVKDGKVIGAVGVSGSAVPNDVKVAEAAVRAFETIGKKWTRTIQQLETKQDLNNDKSKVRGSIQKMNIPSHLFILL